MTKLRQSPKGAATSKRAAEQGHEGTSVFRTVRRGRTMSARAWLVVAVPILYVGMSTRCYMASKDIAESLSRSLSPYTEKASVLLGRAATELSRALLGQAKQIDVKSHVIVQ